MAALATHLVEEEQHIRVLAKQNTTPPSCVERTARDVKPAKRKMLLISYVWMSYCDNPSPSTTPPALIEPLRGTSRQYRKRTIQSTLTVQWPHTTHVKVACRVSTFEVQSIFLRGLDWPTYTRGTNRQYLAMLDSKCYKNFHMIGHTNEQSRNTPRAPNCISVVSS